MGPPETEIMGQPTRLTEFYSSTLPSLVISLANHSATKSSMVKLALPRESYMNLTSGEIDPSGSDLMVKADLRLTPLTLKVLLPSYLTMNHQGSS